MRLKGKVLELGENTASIDALSVNNISYISMVKPPEEKTIVMNSGKHFLLNYDPDKAPQLFAQLEGCINSAGAGGGDFDLSNASKNKLPPDKRN